MDHITVIPILRFFFFRTASQFFESKANYETGLDIILLFDNYEAAMKIMQGFLFSVHLFSPLHNPL